MLTAVRTILRRTGCVVERNHPLSSTLVQPVITSCSSHHGLTCSSSAACKHSGYSASFSTCPKSVSELAIALKVPDDIFLSKYGFEKPQQNDNIVFVCASGVRSFRALRTVLDMGYKNLCITRSYSQSAKMSGAISPEKHLAYGDLARLIDRKEIYLVDVREPHELKETGELPDSVNIPLNELRDALSVLSDKEFQKKYKSRKPSIDSPVVFSCRSGARSLKALQLALELGYERAKHYKGGFLDWEAHTKKD